jgi:hypothetical protein
MVSVTASLLAQARGLAGAIRIFVGAGLPDRVGLHDASFDNVPCETVLMHSHNPAR